MLGRDGQWFRGLAAVVLTGRGVSIASLTVARCEAWQIGGVLERYACAAVQLSDRPREFHR